MFIIRNFIKKDADAVAKLIPQLTANIIQPENLPARMEIIADSANIKAIVAEAGGIIVGFAELAWYLIPSKGKIAWLEEVVVDENYRGQGLGKLMMEKIIAIAKELECRQIKLTVSNPIAEKLYAKFDFIKKETQVMVKQII